MQTTFIGARNFLCKLPEKARPGLKKLIQKAFTALTGEGQRRLKVIPRFTNERSGLSLMFAVLVDASAGWRGVKITPAISRELNFLKTDSTAKLAVRLEL